MVTKILTENLLNWASIGDMFLIPGNATSRHLHCELWPHA